MYALHTHFMDISIYQYHTFKKYSTFTSKTSPCPAYSFYEHEYISVSCPFITIIFFQKDSNEYCCGYLYHSKWHSLQIKQSYQADLLINPAPNQYNRTWLINHDKWLSNQIWLIKHGILMDFPKQYCRINDTI